MFSIDGFANPRFSLLVYMKAFMHGIKTCGEIKFAALVWLSIYTCLRLPLLSSLLTPL